MVIDQGDLRISFLRTLLISLICFQLILPASIYSTLGYANDGQVQSYLKAAKSADKAAEASDTMTYVWGGVGVICLAVCVASMAGGSIISAGTDNYICMGASLGGAIADFAMTKKVESALLGLAGPAVSLATYNPAPPAQGATGAVSAVKTGPATSAATAGGVGGSLKQSAAEGDMGTGAAFRNLQYMQANGSEEQIAAAQGAFDRASAAYNATRTTAAAPSGTNAPLNVNEDPGYPGMHGNEVAKNLDQNFEGAKPDPVKPEAKPAASKNWGACLSAAVAILQAFMKHSNAEEQKKSAKENRDAAAKIQAQDQAASVVASAGSQKTDDPTGGTAAVSTPYSAAPYTSSTSPATAGGLSVTSADDSNIQHKLAFAVANDNALPKAVNSPLFLREFKLVSRQNFEDFIKKPYASPAEAISDAMKPFLKPKQSFYLSSLLKNLGNHYKTNGTHSAPDFRKSPQVANNFV